MAAVSIHAGAVQAQDAADERRVDINEYEVAGNTLLSVIEVQKAVYPFEGPGRTLGDTEKARAALQKAYEAKGFQAVSVVLPPQSVTGGVVRLEVVEAKTAQVVVKGQKFVSKQEVLGGLPAIEPGQSPNFKDLNSQLVALNTKSADLQVTPQLKPGSVPDTLDVELDVQDKSPLHGSLELNNNFSNDTHPYRLQATLSYDDLWHLGHSISAMYDVAPQSRQDAEVYALTYSAPIPGTDVRLALTGLQSNSNVTTLGSTGVLGKGHSVTLTASAPLKTFGGFSQSLQLSVAYKDFSDVINAPDPTTGQTRVNAAPITYFPISVAYNADWRGAKDMVSASSAVTFAFRGLDSGQTAWDNKRYLAQGNFVYLHSQFSWQHELPYAAQLWVEGDGQLANMPLISNEQFSAGGQGSVRGYLLSAALGDKGVHGTVELRTPPLAIYLDKGGVVFNELRGLVFFDAAHAEINDPLPDQQWRYGLMSLGMGLRSQLFKTIHFDGDLGFPLTTTPPTQSGDPRADFRLYTQF